MSTEEVRYNEGGWYEIDGHESYCGSDDPRYLRALLRAMSSTTPSPEPRADLRTLAAEIPGEWIEAAARAQFDADQEPERLNRWEDIGDCLRQAYRDRARAGLAAVLPEHRRMVLTEAGKALERARQARIRADGHPIGSGWDEAEWVLDRLAAAAPPAGLSATVPAGNAPAVPEEADGQQAGEGPYRVGRKVGRTIYRMAGNEPSDADELIGVMDSPALAAFAVRGMNAEETIRRLEIELEHWRTVIVPELMEQRDRLGTDRDRLAAQVAHYQRVVEAAKAHRAAMRRSSVFRVETSFEATQALSALDAAVDALPDAGTDQTEGEQ